MLQLGAFYNTPVMPLYVDLVWPSCIMQRPAPRTHSQATIEAFIVEIIVVMFCIVSLAAPQRH